MPKRRTWILLLVCAVLAIVLLAVLTRDKQPSFQGHRLSEWVETYGAPTKGTPSPQREEAADAIRHIGTNALPCLLAWLDYEPAPWKLKLRTTVQNLPKWISQSRPATLLLATKQAPAERAATAFGALGPIAAPAIPELSRRIDLTNSPNKRYFALYALTSIGPAAEPTMAKVMSNLDEEGSLWAAVSISGLGTNARPLIPWLVQNLQNTNWRVALYSAKTLGYLRLDSDAVVPALTKNLADPNDHLRAQSATTLRRFVDLARPALPALSNALNDPNPVVRAAAIDAIRAIAPQALTNAPAQ